MIHHLFRSSTTHAHIGENQGVSAMASTRIQQWALLLGRYDYVIQYKPRKKQIIADAPSHLPLPGTAGKETPVPGEMILLMVHLTTTPVSACQINHCTERDPLLAKLKRYLQHEWPNVMPENSDVRPHERRRYELNLQEGYMYVLWGTRVVIPPAWEMWLYKSYCTWNSSRNGLDESIRKVVHLVAKPRCWLEAKVKSCTVCQLYTSQSTRVCTTALLGVSTNTMIQGSCRFCRSCFREDVPGVSGCTHQM